MSDFSVIGMTEATTTGAGRRAVGTPVRRERHSSAALAGLALCVLAIGTGEHAVAGMLPAVAAGLGTGVAAAGQLVTVYAATVMLVGPALTGGGERLPGARGGVFRQKISNAERVLATMLYQAQAMHPRHPRRPVPRQPTNHRRRRPRGRPNPAQNGYAPAPATHRFATAAALLESVAPHEDAATPAT